MNSDMLAAGVELGDRYDFDLVHGHDWLVAMACDHLARRFTSPLVTTIHATEHGRHQGWVDKHPQSHIHGVEQWITNRSDRVIACSYYMREQIADIFGVEDSRVAVIPNGIDPGDLRPQSKVELERLRLEFAQPDEKLVLLIGRLVYEKGFQLALEAMPALIERLPRTRFLVAGSGTHEDELRRQADELGTDGPRHLPRLDRRRRAAFALPDRRRLRGPVDLRAVRARRAGGHGVRAARASSRTPAGCARSSRTRRPAFGSAPATRRPWSTWPPASYPTTSSAAAWWPRRSRTCAASTGSTWRSGPLPSTRADARAGLISNHSAPPSGAPAPPPARAPPGPASERLRRLAHPEDAGGDAADHRVRRAHPA